MKTIMLEIEGHKGVIGRLYKIGDQFVIKDTKDDRIQKSLEEWSTHGFYHWVGEKAKTRRIFISSKNPEFLSILGTHINEQTGLKAAIVIKDED